MALCSSWKPDSCTFSPGLHLAVGCRPAWKKTRGMAMLTIPRKLRGQSVRFPERQGIWATTNLLPNLRQVT